MFSHVSSIRNLLLKKTGQSRLLFLSMSPNSNLLFFSSHAPIFGAETLHSGIVLAPVSPASLSFLPESMKWVGITVSRVYRWENWGPEDAMPAF